MVAPSRIQACAVVAFLTVVSTASAKYSGGTGEPNDPYQIATAADLIALGETPEDYDKQFILTADIDLDPNLPGGRVFDKAVIAPDTIPGRALYFDGTPFTGVFDGNDHTISHLTVTGGSYLGLFGQLGSAASVSNLGLAAVEVSGDWPVGGLVGSNAGTIATSYITGSVRGSTAVGGLAGSNTGSMSLSYSSGSVIGTQWAIGGLVGGNSGDVIQCHSTGSVHGGGEVGGLAGANVGTVIKSYSTTSVVGDSDVGGLVGYNLEASVSSSHSSGTVSGTENVGGLVGRSWDASIVSCNSTGTVSGQSDVGGLVGYSYETSISASYSSGWVSGTSYVGGLVGSNCWFARISRSSSSASVSGSDHVGGLVGYSYASPVETSYSRGSVSGTEHVGGLMGKNEWHSSIRHSYSTGRVTGDSNVGGLVGSSALADVVVSFWDSEASGQAKSAGGIGKTTVGMQTASTFLDAGWDFVGETANGTEDVWWIDEGKDYPRLSWEGPAGVVLVDIPAGTFEMGDHDIAVYRDDQKPVHTVALDGFQMSRCETTNAQYAQFLNEAMAASLIQVVNGVVYASSDASLAQAYCDTYASSSYSQIDYSQGWFTVRSRDGLAMADHPVARVSWYGAKAFCDYYGYRLPTEAEWEYAARGGYHNPYYRYPWGSDEIDCSKANCKTDEGFCNPLGLTSWPFTVPVGYYGPQGAYGLCDMSGNLWEWCQDWYDAGYYAVSPTSNPAGPETGATRVLRGGAWDVHGNSCDVAGRSIGDPAVRGQVVGFRVCR